MTERSQKVPALSEVSEYAGTDAPGVLTVLHILPSLEIGGMEQVVAQLVRALDQSRFRPVIACIESLGPIGKELQSKGIHVVQVPSMPSIVSVLYPRPLIRLIREMRPDVVHIHSGCWFRAAIAARLAGLNRVIYTEHGRVLPERTILIMLDRLACRLTRKVVAVSPQLEDYMRTVVRVPVGKLMVIMNGLNTESFRAGSVHKDATDIRVGVIARLEPVKDIATLLRAIKLVSAECSETVLLVVGDGRERTSLEELSRELDIADRVKFFGFRQDIPEVLGKIDIFALSSLSEGTSISILEAMAAGKPVVATRVGGNPALIRDGENGFLVAPGDPSELAKALQRLVKDEALRKEMGENNRLKAVREFGIEAVADLYESLYEEES